jgi:outer membrane protein TolC
MAQESHDPLRLTLADALQKANAVNLQVMMASARLQQAIARISQARSDLLPHVDGIVSGGRQTGDLRAEGLKIPIPGFSTHVGPYNTFDARPRVTVTLFDASALERFRAAKKGENLSQAELEKTREDVLALVSSLYLDAQRKQQTVGLLKTILEKDQMAYDLSETGYAQGTGTLLDVNKLKSNLDQTHYLYQQAKVQAGDACLDLAAALQLPLDQPLVFIDDKGFMETLEKNAGAGPEAKTNADVVVAASGLQLSLADQKTAWADFLPKISGSADYGRSGESPGHGSNTYAVGLKATIPIWDGASQQAKLKEVKGELKEAQEKLLDAQAQAQVKIESARAAIIEADDLGIATTQQRKTVQRALKIALQAQQAGSGSVFDIMQAKADLAQAEDAYNEAQAAWVMSHIDLLHAQGRLRDLIKTEE